MHAVINDARHHEQRGLKAGVVQDMKYRRHSAKSGPGAKQEANQAKMRDGREREQSLEVIFEEGDECAKHHGDQTDRADQRDPDIGARQDWPHAGHQEQAGFDHRGRVQISGHRGWRAHRVGQPEVERELRGFCETAGQDQQQGRQIQRRGLDQLAVFQDDGQVIAADNLTKDQHAADHRKPAHTGDGQGHPCALAPCRQMFPKADQQEGR